MPVPERFQISPAPADLVAKMCDFCDLIEEADDENRDSLLAQWHEQATRPCKAIEFRMYWKSTDKEDFVREALNPRPQLVEDVTYAEVLAVCEYMLSAEQEYEQYYYRDWLEAQLPNSNIHDLIFHPDEWFGDASLFRDKNGAFKRGSELTREQVLAYAMAKSNRRLPGAPDAVSLPYPMP